MPRIEPSWTEVAALISADGDESHVASRILELREAQGWTQTELARRVSRELLPAHAQEAPDPIDRIAIWKIENPQSTEKTSGGRRVRIAELIAFAKVFDTTIAELLLPPGAAERQRAWAQITAAFEALDSVRSAWATYYDAIRRARAFLREDDQLTEQVHAKREVEMRTFTESHRKSWERHGNGLLGGTKNDLAAWAEERKIENPTPLIAALDDLLSDADIDMRGWAVGRTVPKSEEE